MTMPSADPRFPAATPVIKKPRDVHLCRVLARGTLLIASATIALGTMGISMARSEPMVLSDQVMDDVTAGFTHTISHGAVTVSVSASQEVVHDNGTTLVARSISIALSKGGDATTSSGSDSGDGFASTTGTASTSGGEKSMVRSISMVRGASSSGTGSSVSIAYANSSGGDLQATTGGEVRSDGQAIVVVVGALTTLAAYATHGSYGYTAATGSGPVQFMSIARAKGSTAAVATP